MLIETYFCDVLDAFSLKFHQKYQKYNARIPHDRSPVGWGSRNTRRDRSEDVGVSKGDLSGSGSDFRPVSGFSPVLRFDLV